MDGTTARLGEKELLTSLEILSHDIDATALFVVGKSVIGFLDVQNPSALY